ncbi:hypothetical protein [Lysinibacillus fusiformis]|uniref:hypothetical protein n=1 Tax=Lysinibacillus fusiformis TaxID=28031 RepID=UPI0035570D98
MALLVQLFVAEGAKVVLVDLNEEMFKQFTFQILGATSVDIRVVYQSLFSL